MDEEQKKLIERLEEQIKEISAIQEQLKKAIEKNGNGNGKKHINTDKKHPKTNNTDLPH